MNFTVEWTDEALDGLAAVWTASDDRQGVTDASYRIEARLRSDPLSTGESRDDEDRLVFDPPLQATFRVFPDQQLALVTAVGPSRRPR
jgi:hypothetical protein